MSTELISAIAAVLAGSAGWGLWWNKRRELAAQKDERQDTKQGALFDDALELAKAQKDLTEQHKTAAEDATLALQNVTLKARELERTIDGLMADIDKWKGVAVGVAVEHKRKTGAVPLAWPAGEPFPAVS